MSRAYDRARPPISETGLSPAGVVSDWPVHPVIAVANNAGFFVDFACQFQSLTIDAGPADRYGNMPAGRAFVRMLDPGGFQGRVGADLKLADWSVGNEVIIYATNGVWRNPLFRGLLSRFDNLGHNVIELEAFDATKQTAAPLAGPYTPGNPGDLPGLRIVSILALTLGTNPRQFDPGTNQMTMQQTSAQPIDEIRAVAQSDGGVFFTDADGTDRYFDRRWRGGRFDQPAPPEISDNYCGAANIAWNVEYTTNDDGQADKVVLQNVAGLVATDQRSTPPALRNLVVNQTKQQWTTQIEGDDLAQFLLRNSPAAGDFVVRGLQLYPLDPAQPALPYLATDLRLFDVINVIHDQPFLSPARLTIPTLVIGLRHEVSPEDGWVTTVRTIRSVPTLKTWLWDDTPINLWDDTPLKYWSY